jgi:cell division protein FtsB
VGGFARRWWPVLALLLILAALQAKLWMGAGGLPDARALRQDVTLQRAENKKLQERNDALSAEVEDLKSGEAAVEERARSELGMVKPGETFYRVVEPHAGASVAPAMPATLPSPLENSVPKSTANAEGADTTDDAAPTDDTAPAGDTPP